MMQVLFSDCLQSLDFEELGVPEYPGPMTQEDWIRREIQEALDRLGWSQAELCRRTKNVVKAGTLSSFMRGRTRHMSEDRIAAIEQVLGVNLSTWPPPRSSDSAKPAGPLRLDPSNKAASIVPVVDFERFPPGMEGSALREELEKIAFKHRLSLVSDPAAFSVPVKKPFEEFLSGDEVTFSPATPPVHQDFVAVVHPQDRKPRLAKYLILDGEAFALLPDGEHLKNPKVLGVAADLWRPLLALARR